jgi:hypothetical protein
MSFIVERKRKRGGAFGVTMFLICLSASSSYFSAGDQVAGYWLAVAAITFLVTI